MSYLMLLEGETKVMDEGIEGRRISVTRTVKLGDQVLFSDSFSSHYRPKIHVVRIGKKKKVLTTAPAVTPAKPSSSTNSGSQSPD